MSKLCKHCGAEMDDEAFECPECLVKIPGAELLMKQKAIEKKQKRKARLITAGVSFGGLAVIVALVLLVTSINKKPSDYYTKPIDSFIEGCLENDYKEYMSAFTDYMGTYLAKQFSYIMLGEVPDDDQKIYTAAILYLDAYYQEMLSTYGTDVEVTYEIHDEKRYDSTQLQKYQNEYINLYKEGLAGTVFNDGYELIITFYVDGMLGKNAITESAYQVFQIGDEWYIMYAADFFKEEEEKNVESYK